MLTREFVAVLLFSSLSESKMPVFCTIEGRLPFCLTAQYYRRRDRFKDVMPDGSRLALSDPTKRLTSFKLITKSELGCVVLDVPYVVYVELDSRQFPIGESTISV